MVDISGSPENESTAGSVEHGAYQMETTEMCEVCFCRPANGTYDIDGIETWGCNHCVWQWKQNDEGYWVPEIYNG